MVEYDTRTALLVVDMQNDFADPRGSLYVKGGDTIVQPLNHEILKAREAVALIVYTQDWHPETTPHFAKDGGVWPVHCVHDSWGADFHPDLVLSGDIVRKGTGGEDGYSGFTVRDPHSGSTTATQLGSMLEQNAVERIVLAGLATDYCVKDTALDAVAQGWPVTVLSDLIRAVNLEPGDGDRAIAAMRAAGVEIAQA